MKVRSLNVKAHHILVQLGELPYMGNRGMRGCKHLINDSYLACILEDLLINLNVRGNVLLVAVAFPDMCSFLT